MKGRSCIGRGIHTVTLVGRLLDACTSGGVGRTEVASLQLSLASSDEKTVTTGFWGEEKGPAGAGEKVSLEKISGSSSLPGGRGVGPSRSSTVFEDSHRRKCREEHAVFLMNVSGKRRGSSQRRRRGTIVALLFRMEGGHNLSASKTVDYDRIKDF